MPKIIEIHDVISYEDEYILIIPDNASGSPERYSVVKMKSSPSISITYPSVIIGRELDLSLARKIANSCPNFIEDNKTNYKNRTERNILISDGTLAIAFDPLSMGEKVTHNLCIKHQKPYMMINLNEIENIQKTQEYISSFLEENKIKKLNIAGNSICTINKIKKLSQKQIDNLVFNLLNHNMINLTHINSGGQTGIDEAGIKFAIKKRIPSTIICPKGFKFRDINGYDISNVSLFKERFF